MNPPFEKGQDIEHVRHAYDQLKPGGRVVAIMSEGPFFRSDKKATEFRDWLESRRRHQREAGRGIVHRQGRRSARPASTRAWW
jgi:hypothetical protein